MIAPRPAIAVLALAACAGSAAAALPLQSAGPSPFEALPYAPRHYVVARAPTRLAVDGRLDEPAWQQAPWSDAFVDIEGDRRPRPRFATRVKMLWDADRFYVAAEMEEPDLWGTLTARDSVIYHDNDFEVFIDPDGDTHNYYELEVNVLGTAWDLFLAKPYRDGGPADNGWDIAGLEIGIDARGTVNVPGDRDRGWTLEIAMPWSAFLAHAPGRRPPGAGDRWRVNFSRVEWRADVVSGRYVKPIDPATGRPRAEDNWVWSPQGAIAMHMPERWGVVEFSDAAAGSAPEAFRDDPNEAVRWALRRLYYRQAAFKKAHGRFATTLTDLGADDMRIGGALPAIEVMGDRYEMRAPGVRGGLIRLRQDGKVWQ
jgi:hypothetical protein